MKMTKVWMLGMAAVVLPASSGCYSVAAQTDKTPSVTSTVKPSWEGLSLSIQLAQPKTQPQVDVNVSQPIGIHIIFKNISAQEHTLPLASELNRSSIILKNDKGESVPLTRYGQRNVGKPFTLAEITPKRLKPGEEYRFSFVLNRFFDMTESGTYFLTVKYKAPLYVGPQHSVPKGLIPAPEPRGDEPEPRIRQFQPPNVNGMPNPLYERERNRTILIPAPENTPNIPEIVSNTLAIEVNDQSTAWIYQGEARRTE